LWYDALTIDGRVSCQSRLNELNLPFFEATDIFLDYHWNEDYLESSAQVAGQRKKEVYVGIDVWGRGTFGGGGFGTWKVCLY